MVVTKGRYIKGHSFKVVEDKGTVRYFHNLNEVTKEVYDRNIFLCEQWIKRK